MLSNIKQLKPEDDAVDGIVIPTTVYKDVEQMIKGLKDSKLTTEEKETVSIAITGRANTLKDLEGMDFTEVRDVTHSKQINITEKSDPIAVMMVDLSLGVKEEVELLHSGFKLTLKPITDDHFIALDARLARETIRLGRDTNGMIYTNISVGLVKFIVDFIVPNILSTTLKLDNNDNIMDYIKIQDLNSLLIGAVNSRYTDGVTIVRGCINTTVIVDNKPKCLHTISALLDSSRLTKVNADKVTEEMDVFMSKQEVTKAEVLEYQNNLLTKQTNKLTVPLNGSALYVNLKIPTIKEYIETGEYWVKRVIKKSEAILREKVTEDEKETLIDIQSKQMYLGSYLHFVESIVTTNTTIDKLFKVNQALATLAGNKEAYNAILDGIEQYKKDITLSVVGISTYMCPSCSEKQTDDKDVLIPLDMIKTFFDLTSLQNTLIMERGQNTY